MCHYKREKKKNIIKNKKNKQKNKTQKTKKTE